MLESDDAEETTFALGDDLEFALRVSGAGDDDPSLGAVDIEEDVFEEGVDATRTPPAVADGEREMDNGQAVYSVEEFLPRLLRRKYGDNWEEVVAEAEASGEYEIDDEDDDGYTEEELRQMVTKQREADATAGDGDTMSELEAAMAALEEGERVGTTEAAAESEAEDDEDDEDEDGEEGYRRPRANEAEIERALGGGDGSELSDQLVEFAKLLDGGLIELPKPYPASEWLQIFASACTDTRHSRSANIFANLRVFIAHNFDDFVIPDDARGLGVMERALIKARAVYQATGMPSIGESSCCYIEAQGQKPASEVLYDPDGDQAEALIGRQRAVSENERLVIFQSATAFVSERGTFTGYGAFEMPMIFASADNAVVANQLAHDELFVQISEEWELPFVGSAGFEEFYDLQQQRTAGKMRRKTAGTLLLREKLLREATLLEGDILKVSSFLNHMVDVELIEACGEELAERLEDTQPTKVLTVEATGLLPAVFVGKALGLPVVFARKSRQIGVSDSYQVSYKSQMHSSVQDLYVAVDYLNPGDRVVIIDDFLAGGRTADALIRVCRMANANVVGGGFLIEKLEDAGRAFLSGYQVPLEAIALVSIEDGSIQVRDQGIGGDDDDVDDDVDDAGDAGEVAGSEGDEGEGEGVADGVDVIGVAGAGELMDAGEALMDAGEARMESDGEMTDDR